MRIERFRFFSSFSAVKTVSRGLRPRTDLPGLRAWLCAGLLAIFACTAALAKPKNNTGPKNYTKIVVFGDSLSDTGNVAKLSSEKYFFAIPGPIANYTYGRFTDGPDTSPKAQNYFGVWIEQLAKDLTTNPPVVDSLNGGTNYAYGYAMTGNGTSKLCFDQYCLLYVEVENIGQQITDYLSTHPRINSRTLFVIWGGAENVLQALTANDIATTQQDIYNGSVEESNDIQRLIEAGATQILVPNLPPLGLVPRFNTSPYADAATGAANDYNIYLASAISSLQQLYAQRHVTFYQLDVFGDMENIVAAPTAYGLTDVTDSSQGLSVNPDTYLFWDDLHPTTKGHNILANAALSVLGQ